MALRKARKPSNIAGCGSRSGSAASMTAQAADSPASSTASSIARRGMGFAQFAGIVAELFGEPGPPGDLDHVAGLPDRTGTARDAAGHEARVATVLARQQRHDEARFRREAAPSARCPRRSNPCVCMPRPSQTALGCGHVPKLRRRAMLGAQARLPPFPSRLFAQTATSEPGRVILQGVQSGDVEPVEQRDPLEPRRPACAHDRRVCNDGELRRCNAPSGDRSALEAADFTSRVRLDRAAAGADPFLSHCLCSISATTRRRLSELDSGTRSGPPPRRTAM